MMPKHGGLRPIRLVGKHFGHVAPRRNKIFVSRTPKTILPAYKKFKPKPCRIEFRLGQKNVIGHIEKVAGDYKAWIFDATQPHIGAFFEISGLNLETKQISHAIKRANITKEFEEKFVDSDLALEFLWKNVFEKEKAERTILNKKRQLSKRLRKK